MQMRAIHLLIVAAVVGAAAFAIVRDPAPAPASASPTPAVSPPPAAGAPGQFLVKQAEDLAPKHPPIGQGGSHAGGVSAHTPADDFAPADQVPAVLTWMAPAGWPSTANPNAMRLASHKVPRVAGDSDDAELSISRAGGDTGANIERWIGQFQGAGKEQRRTKTVQGFSVTLVEVAGTYSGGMGAANASHKNWVLMAAIVETPPQPYFFKVIGPAATVHAARKAFDAMVDGIVAR